MRAPRPTAPSRRPRLLPLLLLAPLVGCDGADRTAPGPDEGDEATVRRVVAAMGTELVVECTSVDRRAALMAAEAAVDAVEATEARLTNWDPTSEIERLVRDGSRTPSVELAADLASFEPFVLATDGAFDPRRAAPHASDASGAGRIDTGGWGKGRALDLAADAALEAGAHRVQLSFGGQALERGDADRARARIVLADPDDRGRAVLSIEPPHDGSATSNQALRPGHLVDPRGPRAVRVDRTGSLTVFCDDAIAADALSTGLFVLGPDRALAFAARRADCEVLVLERVDGALVARASNGLAGRLEPLVDELTTTVVDAAVDADHAPISDPTR